MADDQTTKVVLDLDNEAFMSKMKDAIGMMGQLGSGDGFDGLIEKITTIGAILGPIAVAILAVKTALDLTKEAEHIEQVNKSFNMLAANAGLAGDAIKEKLVAAAGGMASETDIIQAGSRAILEMGENAKHIPEIMELARKYTANYGGDLIDNFNRMSMAMENGNQKALRQFGITVDLTKAHQDFASSIGTSSEYLSQAGQKQAVFNAALDDARKKFENLDTSGLKVTSNMQKIMTAFTELKETVALVFGYIEQRFHILETLTSAFATAMGFVNDTVKKMIPVQEDHKKAVEDSATAQGKLASAIDQTNSRYKDTQKITKDQQKFHQELLKLHEDRIKADEKLETDYGNFQIQKSQEIENVKKQAQIKEDQLRTQALNKGLITQQEYDKSVEDIERKKTDDIRQIELKHQNDQVTALKNLETQNATTATGFEASWRKNSTQASLDMQNFAKLGDKSFSIVGSQATKAFTDMGKGSKDAGQAMQGFLFGSIGQIATAQGTEILLASIWPPNPIGLAAGGALIAFGAALSSVGSSTGSSAPTASSASAGSAVAATDTTAAASSTSPTPTAAQQKSLTVQVQGNIFETDQTRTRLMDMIRQSQDYTDFSLLNIGQKG